MFKEKRPRRRRKFIPKNSVLDKTEVIKSEDKDSPSSSSDSEEDEATSHPYQSLIESLRSGAELSKQSSSESENSSSTDSEEPHSKRAKVSKENQFYASSTSDESEEETEKEAGGEEESDVLAEDEGAESETESSQALDDRKFDLLTFNDSDAEDDGKRKRKKSQTHDYYKSHIESNIEDKIKGIQQNKPQAFQSLQWPTLSTLRCTGRAPEADSSKKSHPHAPTHPIPKNIDPSTLEKTHHVRKVLVDNWCELTRVKTNNNGARTGDGTKLFTPLQRELFSLFNSYCDVLYNGQDILKNTEEIRRAYCLHAANHILRARARVLRNTARLKQMTPEEREQTDYRDQGLTRPKVLILVPFRETALCVVNTMLHLLKRGKKFEVSYKRRFRDEFRKKTDEDEDSDEERRRLSKKPEDFQNLFAGNTDEHFRVGIALLRNSVRLYAPFYSSDIIVASPLGIRTVIGAEGESHYEHDFLSSIELLIMDHTDVFMMQNWEHILHIFEHLHLTPKESHGVDFSRVRNWSLDGHAKYYRQTIAISSVSLPQISSLFTKFCWNYRGAVIAEGALDKGSICAIAKQLPQVFHKLSPATLVDAAEVRFRFFTERIYNQYKDPGMSHTLIYVPQYFDFVRLRNYMRKQWKDGAGPIFGHVNDYSTPTEVGKAKRRFFLGKCPLLLYTERYHFYNRTRIRGIRNLIFYELPTFPHFYSELCNMVRDSNLGTSAAATFGSVLVTYSRYDARKLSAIVGVARSRELLTSAKSVHMFVTGASTDA